MTKLIYSSILITFTILCTNLNAEVIFTELMYNPASKEKVPAKTEWLELYNTGTEPVSLAGYYLADEDGKTEAFPEDLEIKPNQAIVFIPGDQTVEKFKEAWKCDAPVIPVKKWNNGGMKGLANNPTDTNEILTLCDSSGQVIDRLNYDDNRPWPSDSKQGPSIYLALDKLSSTENDNGENWHKSKLGTNGAINNKITADYDKTDTGSPGFVRTEDKNNAQETKDAQKTDDADTGDSSDDSNVDAT
ncbi:lamin tail domain-containing protein [Planctomycetota bacterium]|nr:lamin tail domain-containing protein [Planctomycetota bacterium]